MDNDVLSSAIDNAIESWIEKGEQLEAGSREAESHARALGEYLKAKTQLDLADFRAETDRMKAENEAARNNLEELRQRELLRNQAIEYRKVLVEEKKVRSMNLQTFVNFITTGLALGLTVYELKEVWDFESKGGFVRTKNACNTAMRFFEGTIGSITRRFR